MKTFHLLKLNLPIFQQLQIEEALLRADQRNWCILNQGSPTAIVMGISGNPQRLIDLEHLRNFPVPLIKRFSGGGTVVIDENTLFTTFIGNKEDLKVACCTNEIHLWAKKIYKEIFPTEFNLTENDYTFGDRKFGGNAQYLRKDRWLHHTSFLWDFKQSNMSYLLMPNKIPAYRKQRTHSDFLCRLKDFLSEKEKLISNLVESLKKNYTVKEISLDSLEAILQKPHRKATVLLE